MSDETPKLGSSTRKPLGKGGGWLEIEIAPDGQQAKLTALYLGGDTSVDGTEIVRVLQEEVCLKAQFDMAQIKQCLSFASADLHKIFRSTFVVAHHKPPQSGLNGQAIYPCLDHIDTQDDLHFVDLKASFEQEMLSAVLNRDLQTCMVAPQDTLAILRPPQVGLTGQNVLGHPIPGLMGQAVQLNAGQHVTETDGIYTSNIYGYVCLINDEISVIDPIWVSPDFISAYFIYFPQVGAQRLPDPSWIQAGLKQKGIEYGIQSDAITRLRQEVVERKEKGAFLIAQGKEVKQGEDGKIQYSFSPKKQPGQLLDDGSIDFHERNGAIAVKKDQLLAEIIPPTQGQNGFDLTGKETIARDGQEKHVGVGEQVRVVLEDNKPHLFFSKIDGNAHLAGNTLTVKDVLMIHGDVDYDLGNVDAGKDIVISGSVQSGFEVKASGDILIGGVAEQGAVISAQGDVVIARGILGDTTKVMAMGDVETKFVQNSSVMARGDIRIGRYILNSTVRAGGELIVHAQGSTSRRAGTIAGGSALSGRYIQARLAGAAMSDQTIIGIVSDMETQARIEKLKKGIDFCNTEILRMFRTLKIKEFNEEEVRKVLERTQSAQREHVSGILRKLQKLIQLRAEGIEQQQVLEEKQAEKLTEAEIVITGQIRSDVQIRFGEQTQMITKNLTSPTFSFENDEIKW